MTVPAHATTAEVPAPMPRTAEPGQAAAVNDQAATPTGAGVGRRALQQLGENPLLALFGTAIIALLILNFNSINDRISRLEARMDARFAALEEDMAELREDMDELREDMDELREGMAELDRKLTALVAALNMTEEIDAALEGRLVRTPSPDTGPAGADAAPG